MSAERDSATAKVKDLMAQLQGVSGDRDQLERVMTAVRERLANRRGSRTFDALVVQR